MMKVNPLNVYEIRRVEFCPPYFETAILTQRYQLRQSIDEWIYNNLAGRFYVGQEVIAEEGTSLQHTTVVGFETPSELTLFMLGCPYLK
jgi:hypothetical protein